MTNPYDDIRRERVRQDQMHGPKLERHDIPRVLGEEFGEVCAAINDRECVSRVREELVQCAAVCVKAIENIDRMGDARTGTVTHDPAKAVGPTDRIYVGPIREMFSMMRGNLMTGRFPDDLLVKGGDK